MAFTKGNKLAGVTYSIRFPLRVNTQYMGRSFLSCYLIVKNLTFAFSQATLIRCSYFPTCPSVS